MSDKIETIEDYVDGMEVRWTDNSVKDGDPKQIASNIAEPLKLDENGLPIVEDK